MNLFNIFKKKPNSVQYGEKQGQQIARPFIQKDGSTEMDIKGERYPLRAFPRHHLLHGPMSPLKRYMKNFVIEQLVKCLPYKIPDENLAEPVRELARVFDLCIEAEDEPAQKHLMTQFKDAICMIAQEDDAWRYRLQAFLQKLNMKKVRLNESDKYYFRGKSWKVDEYLNDKL